MNLEEARARARGGDFTELNAPQPEPEDVPYVTGAITIVGTLGGIDDHHLDCKILESVDQMKTSELAAEILDFAVNIANYPVKGTDITIEVDSTNNMNVALTAMVPNVPAGTGGNTQSVQFQICDRATAPYFTLAKWKP